MKYQKHKLFAALSVMLLIPALFTNSVRASQQDGENADYVVTYSAEEVTGMDALIDLAFKQQQSKAALSSQEAQTSDLTANQLLEVREYSDGSFEKQYARTSISLGDPKYSTTQSTSQNLSSNKVDNYNVATTFYYTIKGDTSDMIVVRFTYRVDKLVTCITKTNFTGITVTSGSQTYVASKNARKSQNINFSNTGSIGQQFFTLNSSHSGFYETNKDPIAGVLYGVGAEAYVEFSNGQYVLQQFVADDY